MMRTEMLHLAQLLVFLSIALVEVQGENYSVVYGSWSSWSECSKSCGGGTIERSRKCLNVKKCKADSLEEEKPCNEQICPNPKSSEKKEGYPKRKGKSIFLYKVTTFTSEEQEEILSMKVLLTVNPDSGSQSFPLNSVDDFNFTPGETNELFFVSSNDLGDIRSIRLEVINEGESFDCGWEVRMITIVNQATGYEANFICSGSVEAGHPVVIPAILNESPTTKEDEMSQEEYEDEYIPPNTTKKPSHLYHITTMTSEDQPPLAPGKVHVTINPEPQEGGSTVTFKLENQHPNNFGKGETDIFFYESEVDFGKIGSIKLEFIPYKPSYGNTLWRMRKMMITNNDTGYKVTLYSNGSVGSKNRSVTIKVESKLLTIPPTRDYASPKVPGKTKEQKQTIQPDYYPPTLEYKTMNRRTSLKTLNTDLYPTSDERERYEAPQNPRYPPMEEEEEIIDEEYESPETNVEAYQIPPKTAQTETSYSPPEEAKPKPYEHASNEFLVEQKLNHRYPSETEDYYDDDEEEIYRPNIGDTGPFLDVTRQVVPSTKPAKEFDYRVTTVTSAQSSQMATGSAYIIINPRTFSASPKVQLYSDRGSRFKPGQTDVFNFKLQTDYKDLESIEVEYGGNAIWRPSEVTVLNVERRNYQRFRYDGVVGSSEENKSVVLYPTLDGHWCTWSSFSKPPVTCLKPGHPQPTVQRLRKCNCPSPANFGLPCEGVDKESKPANLPLCRGKA